MKYRTQWKNIYWNMCILGVLWIHTSKKCIVFHTNNTPDVLLSSMQITVFYITPELSAVNQGFSGGLKVKVAQSCRTLCNPMDYTVHGILQARILEWVAFSFFRGSSLPRDQTQVSRIAGGLFTSWATRELPWVV